MSMWPPLIMAKLSSLEKKDPPGSTVTVSLPALIKSGSTADSVGNGPCKESEVVVVDATGASSSRGADARLHIVWCAESDRLLWLM
jgi:hypothetical protein